MSEPDPIDTYTGYQLRFWFLGIQPVIWRRLLLRADNTLADLHYAIQITCNWSDDFLHQFKIHGKNIGVPRIYGIAFSEPADKLLADLQLYKMNAFMNITSMSTGSSRSAFEETVALNWRSHYPLCIGGRRAASSEDCGGPAHFNQLCTFFSLLYLSTTS
ncbi:MAG: plasmid pRiA4b ORF-3 family protein [Chloroflexi bacterium]|nr:plasmid pRiA4b ORF-3 family protein [Chloroflexota bacterium]